MSTNSMIGILKPDGRVTAIYCHYDGYLSGVGAMLAQFWNNEEKINSLLTAGNIVSLGAVLPVYNPMVQKMVQNTMLHKADPRIYVCKMPNGRASMYSLDEYCCLRSFNYYFDTMVSRWYCFATSLCGEVVKVDVLRYVQDKAYFYSICKEIEDDEHYARSKDDFMMEWEDMQKDCAYYSKCLRGSLIHNMCAALNKEFKVPQDTYTGSVVKQKGRNGQSTCEYVIYDCLKQGEKRRKRLAVDVNPLICLAKAYTEINKGLQNKRVVLGV